MKSDNALQQPLEHYVDASPTGGTDGLTVSPADYELFLLNYLDLDGEYITRILIETMTTFPHRFTNNLLKYNKLRSTLTFTTINSMHDSKH